MSSGNKLLYCPCHCKHTPILTCLLTIVSAVIYLNSPPSLFWGSVLLQHFTPSSLLTPVFPSSIPTCLHLFIPAFFPSSQPHTFHHLIFSSIYCTLISLFSFAAHFSHSLPVSAAQQHCVVYRAHDWPSRDTVSCTTADFHCNIP